MTRVFDESFLATLSAVQLRLETESDGGVKR